MKSFRKDSVVGWLLGALAVASIGAPVHAAVIYAEGTFLVDYYGSDWEPGGSYDPPLPGPGSFFLRSAPYYPGNEFPYPEFEVLDFSFTFQGWSWDESDVLTTDCYFWPDGTPDGINIAWDDPNSTDRWHLSWNFSDGNFGFQFFVGDVSFSGNSEGGIVGGSFDQFRTWVVPEPGTFSVLGLGLLGMGLTRRRNVR